MNRTIASTRTARLFMAAGLLFLTAGLPAAGPPTITVPEGDVHWGFDGTVMRDRFNPLTLVVDNPTPEAFDGEIRLYRSDFSGRRAGGFLVQTVYLAPGTRRSVQFYPLAMSEMENWTLAWDGGQMLLPQPRLGSPARVLIVPDGDLFDRGGAVKRFPARSFPSYATATDGLAEVVIGEDPEWEPPQRQAFLDWLKSGGVVHLIRGADGLHPRFGGDLAVLDEPTDDFRVGAGRVRRHDIARSGLTIDYVRRQMDPPEPPPEDAAEVARANEYGVYDFPLEEWRTNSGVFTQLKRMVKAEHNWGVIHLLSLSYIAVLFPGCFLIGREFRHVPATFGAIIGATLLYGGAFYLVGNRGYGESTSVHAVALAEHVEADKFDVTAWSSVFLTAGGDYAFSHDGEERLYSDATEAEPVNGEATAGSSASLVVDVPPFSTRVMTHKALVRLPTAGAPTVAGTAGSGPTFKLPKNFPSEVRDAYAVIGDRVVNYRRVGAELQPGTAQPAKEFLKPKNADFLAENDGMWGEELAADTRIAQLVRPLMVYALRVTTDKELKAFRVPQGRVKLFVYAPLAPPLRTKSAATESEEAPEPLAGHTGNVLYSFDLAL